MFQSILFLPVNLWVAATRFVNPFVNLATSISSFLYCFFTFWACTAVNLKYSMSSSSNLRSSQSSFCHPIFRTNIKIDFRCCFLFYLQFLGNMFYSWRMSAKVNHRKISLSCSLRDTMTSSTSDSSLEATFGTWLKDQILRLSVDTLKSRAVTCTACGEVLGTYIIEYQGKRFRYSPEQAYAFLKFVEETQPR